MPELDRRDFLGALTAGAAAATLAAGRSVASGGAPAGAIAAPAFRPLPLGSIRPEGWLLRQLRLQADGLTGHLDEFWPDVARSQWFGGTAEGWERAPYWLDGAVPLAFLLDDGALQERLAGHVARIVDGQRPSGAFGPCPEDPVATRYDPWAILLVNKALVQYHEATGEDRVLEAVARSLRGLQQTLSRVPLFDWGRFRWF
jgi:hypothetical protein